MAFKFFQSLGADDIFISYTRLDAGSPSDSVVGRTKKQFDYRRREERLRRATRRAVAVLALLIIAIAAAAGVAWQQLARGCRHRKGDRRDGARRGGDAGRAGGRAQRAGRG